MGQILGALARFVPRHFQSSMEHWPPRHPAGSDQIHNENPDSEDQIPSTNLPEAVISG